MTLLRPPEWTRQAACAGMTGGDFDPWHPDDDLPPARVALQHAMARRVCAECPVRLACALDALTDALPDGMWGGLTPADRRQVARAHPDMFPRPGAAAHGTRSKYVAGCTTGIGGGACEDCLRSHREYARARRAAMREIRLEPFPWLTAPVGRGKHRGWPGQYVLLPQLVPAPALGAAA